MDCPDITIAAPESVNDFSVEVYGFAQKNQAVDVYVNDTLAGTFTANNATGKYCGAITLPKASDGEKYEIFAQTETAENGKIEVKYASEKPVITNVDFFYNDHKDNSLNITDVFTQGVKPVISFNPSCPIEFRISATNSDQIGRMFVTSTKGNSIKYIEAYYDEPDSAKLKTLQRF